MIITISRQFGSGGRTVGRMAAEKLGLKCYDSEIIEQMAEESGFSKEYIKENAEYSTGTPWFGFSGRSWSAYTPSNEDRMWFEQCRIVKEIASKGDCVIVGRCADYILKDITPCLKIFIHAPKEWRAERIVKVYGESNEAPLKRIEEKDKRRAAYYRIYTDRKWGDMTNFDCSLDSSTFGIDACADMVAYMYRQTKEMEEEKKD